MGDGARLPRQECEDLADMLETYINIWSLAVIKDEDGVSTKRSYGKCLKAVETVNDAIERLRKGKSKHVIKSSMVDVCIQDIHSNKR